VGLAALAHWSHFLQARLAALAAALGMAARGAAELALMVAGAALEAAEEPPLASALQELQHRISIALVADVQAAQVVFFPSAAG